MNWEQAKANSHDPKERSKEHADLLVQGQVKSADLVERQQQDEQVGDHIGDLHAVVEGYQIDALARKDGVPSLADRVAHEDAGK
jgi:hypothetical protein